MLKKSPLKFPFYTFKMSLQQQKQAFWRIMKPIGISQISVDIQ